LTTVLGLIVIGLFAYLGTLLFKIPGIPPSLRALIASGLGFFFVGLLLGPYAANLLDAQAQKSLDVVVNLGVGWVGLLFGLQFYRRDLLRFPTRLYLSAGLQSLFTMLVVALGMWAVVALSPWATPVWLTVGILAIISSTTSPTIAEQMIHDTRPRGPITDAVRLVSSVDAVPAIVLLGIILCFSPLHPEDAGVLGSGWLWVGAACGLGLTLGALFHLITLYRYTDNQLLVIVLGLTVFCGGAAHYLRLSPLFVNMVVGMMVANRSPQRLRILRSLLGVEKPIYLVLLTLAGAMWAVPPVSLFALVPLFILLRLIGKFVGGYLATSVAGLETRSSLGLGPGLVPHGGMAVVIALNVKQFFPGAIGDFALSAAIASVLVAAPMGPYALQRLLRQEGETH
jgi:Kef-type K+ transport system membrane component KefB